MSVTVLYYLLCFFTVPLAQLGLAFLLKETCFALGPSSVCVWMLLLCIVLLERNEHVEQCWLRRV